jgi:DNA-binding MarR family transcriptional regulator
MAQQPMAGSPESTEIRVSTEDLGDLLVEVSKLHRVYVHRALEALGVYRGQNFVLSALAEQDGLAQSELAEQLLVRPPTISNTLERMEAVGWIERRIDPMDRRISRVYLTEAGKSLHGAVSTLWTDLETSTFAGLDQEAMHRLWELLLQIRENLRKGTGLARDRS